MKALILAALLLDIQIARSWSYSGFLKVNVLDYELPDYLIEYCHKFDISPSLAYRWGLAESSHIADAISRKQGYGRFQITEVWFNEYARISRRTIKSDFKTFVLDDQRNCYIWAWSIAFWKRQGYNEREIAQIWLWGETGYTCNGRYSERYEKAIFD
jgi:hypothetical protein